MSQVRKTTTITTSMSSPSLLETAIENFYLDREARRLTAASLRWYRQYITALASWLAEYGIIDPAHVTANDIRAYLVSLENQGLALRSIHHHASAARAFFTFCVDEELIPASPMRKVKMPRLPKDLLPAFTQDDVHKLLAVCDCNRDQAIVLCLLDTGCRASEFCALTVDSVDLVSGGVTIRQGKGRKDRITFLGAKARKALRKYLASRLGRKPTDPLWLCKRGQNGLTVRGLQRALYRLGKRAHVDNCHAHTFRRTCALWSLRAVRWQRQSICSR